MAKYILTFLWKFSTIYQRIVGYLLLFTDFGGFFFFKIQADVQKIIHHILDSVFTIAKPQEQRQPLYGICRLPMIDFRLLVMPFKMFHTFANY
jgi:hypothetical protein